MTLSLIFTPLITFLDQLSLVDFNQVINKGKKISIFKQHENLTLARNSAR